MSIHLEFVTVNVYVINHVALKYVQNYSHKGQITWVHNDSWGILTAISATNIITRLKISKNIEDVNDTIILI